jgi:hypothetical protein
MHSWSFSGDQGHMRPLKSVEIIVTSLTNLLSIVIKRKAQAQSATSARIILTLLVMMDVEGVSLTNIEIPLYFILCNPKPLKPFILGFGRFGIIGKKAVL